MFSENWIFDEKAGTYFPRVKENHEQIEELKIFVDGEESDFTLLVRGFGDFCCVENNFLGIPEFTLYSVFWGGWGEVDKDSEKHRSFQTIFDFLLCKQIEKYWEKEQKFPTALYMDFDRL